jgi:microsomal prostaglandin-E synthase 2
MTLSHPQITLFQFQLCPFCHKVRAALELKGVTYQKVEVAPGNKKELPDLPIDAPRKVPVLQIGDEIIWDSTDILLQIDRLVPQGDLLTTRKPGERDEEVEAFEEWVDQELMPALPTVIYDTWPNAIKAANITARESNFGLMDRFKVKVGGSLIMKLIVKRILKRVGRTDGHAWLQECLDTAEQMVGDKNFVIGEKPTIADAALHGAFKCVEEFPIFEKISSRSTLKAWYDRIQALRDREIS